MDISSICTRSAQTSLPARLLPIAMAIVLLALSFSTATELLAETNAGQAKLDRNKAVVLKFEKEVFYNGNIDAIDDMVQPDALLQLQSNWVSPVTGTNQVIGTDNWKKHFKAFHSIWAKKAEWFKTKNEDVIAEGDTVALRGERVYLDRKSKKVVTRTGMAFIKIKDGKIAALYYLVAAPKLTP